MTKYLEACAVTDDIWAELHERVGLCGHCGKRKCIGRKQHSYLPDKVSVDVVRAAMNAAVKKVRIAAADPPEEMTCGTCAPGIAPHARTDACDMVFRNERGSRCAICDGWDEHDHRGRQS